MTQLAAVDRLLDDLTPDSPLWAWAHDAISHRAETMVSHLEGVRLGEDIEAVHDMRVWSRRLVAAMRVFAVCFPDPDYGRLLREARQVTRRLGAVRDLDVLIDYFERSRETGGPEKALGTEYLLATLQRQRRKARKPMLGAMDRLVETDFPGRLRRYLREEAAAYVVGLKRPGAGGRESGERGQGRQGRGERDTHTPTHPHTNTPAIQSFRRAAPPILTERYRDLYAFEPYVANPEAVEELHAMRIAAKWLRYTMELFAPAYADELKQPLGAVKKIQELLGDLHDSDVRLDILRGALDARLDPRGLEALGLMLGEPVRGSVAALLDAETETRRRCYQAFHKEWRKLARQGFAETCLDRIQTPDAAARPQGGDR
jgi:CHAD domain-containing protein